MKKESPNPSIIINKTTKNGKTSLATPIIITKYFPNAWNTRKNNKNLKFNNKIEIAVSAKGGVPLIRPHIDVATGKEYAPKSISDKRN